MAARKWTYITRMPDKAGAFLQASRVIAQCGGNIVRVNYNKAVDAHTLFIEVQAGDEQHQAIARQLRELGYLGKETTEPRVLLLVLKVQDLVGAAIPVFETIGRYNISVSYISSQENGAAHQYLKLGLMVEEPAAVQRLLEELSKICEVRILDYNITEKSLDNTVFYIAFANEMRQILQLTQDQTNSVLVHSNRIMQTLDERNETPMKTFDYIRQFADFVMEQKGAAFRADVDKRQMPNGMTLYAIQPPCGSSIYVLQKGQELMFVDCGFACYELEMRTLLTRLFGDLDGYHKKIMLTHADIDHTGLLHWFDEIYVNRSCYDNFALESRGEPNFREQNVFHAPYCYLSKIISGYRTPDLEKCVVVGQKRDENTISHIGSVDFEGLTFDFYEGIGGHVKGETAIVCHQLRLAFSGDILVNIEGFSAPQRRFNQLAPYLVTSVNVDSLRAREVREVVTDLLAEYDVYPGHGAPMLRQENRP